MTYKRIRELREDHDLTQTYMAHYLNVNQRTYSRYERGERSVPLEQLCRIADFYKVSVDYLLGRTDVKRNSIKARVLQNTKRHLLSKEMSLYVYMFSFFLFLSGSRLDTAHSTVPAAMQKSERLNTILRISLFFTLKLI